MKLMIDCADYDKIKEIIEFYPIDGVTTNPSILSKLRKNPYEILIQIRNLIGYDKELHVQVISKEIDNIIDEAYKICEVLGDKTFIKIPINKQGLKALIILSNKKFNTTATAIYTPIQAYLAAKAGANYVAPYINRIDNLGFDGVQVAKKIHNILKNNDFKTEILAASFKNSYQVLELCEYGISASTISTDVIDCLINSKDISFAINNFINDFEETYGKGKTMIDF